MTKTAMRDAIELLPKRQMDQAGGLAGWLLNRLRAHRDRAAADKKALHLVETLSLGGRRQLLLIDCGGQQYLVGCGAESVESIVSVTGNGFHAEQLSTEGCR